jgi:hypothetical protein
MKLYLYYVYEFLCMFLVGWVALLITDQYKIGGILQIIIVISFEFTALFVYKYLLQKPS